MQSGQSIFNKKEWNFYGLSMNSTQEDINLTMKKFGFKLNENDGWAKNNCTFSFSSTIISISATVSNKSKVDF